MMRIFKLDLLEFKKGEKTMIGRHVSCALAVTAFAGVCVSAASAGPLPDSASAGPFAYVTEGQYQRVLEVDLITGEQSEVFSGELLSYPVGITFGDNQFMYTVNYCDLVSFKFPSVVRLELITGTQQATWETCAFQVPSDIVVDRRPQANGVIYVLEEFGVISIDPFTSTFQNVSGLSSNIGSSTGNGIEVDKNGNVLVTNFNLLEEARQLLSFNLQTGEEVILIQDNQISSSMGLATDIFGDVYIGQQIEGEPRSIARFNPETGVRETVYSGELLSRVGDMTFSDFDTLLFLTVPRPAVQEETRLLKIDLQTGKAEVVTAGTFNDPFAITAKPPETLPVSMELNRNRFADGSNGRVQVTFFSDMEFDTNTVSDPLQIDVESVRAGPGNAAPLENFTRVRDVNGDGLPDLTVGFSLRELGLQCDNIDLYVHGRLFNGDTFAGRQSVEVVGCGRR